MNSEDESRSIYDSIDSDSEASVEEVAEVFPIEDYSGDEMERQLEDFKKFNSKKLFKLNEEEEVEEEEGWGRSRRDYYGATESEDDEGEAIKIQKVQLQKVREEDYYGEFTEPVERVEKKLKKSETYNTDSFNSHLIESINILKEGAYDPDYLTLKFLYLTNLSFYYSLVNGPEEKNTSSHPILNRIDELGAIIDKIKKSRMPLDCYALDSNQGDKAELDLLESNNESDGQVLIDQESVEEENLSQESLGEDDLVHYDLSDSENSYQPIYEKKERNMTDAFGELEEMNEVDLLDKKNRRKALNFRVSQVENSLIRKIHQRAGDDDIPFKAKSKKELKIEDDAISVSEGDEIMEVNCTQSEDNKGDADIFGEDEYYQKIKLEKLNKKKEREEKYAQLDEPITNNWIDPEMDVDEKRKATWRILANRGLTPFRKKENRNPRVKKRLKYEKAVKKLPSTRRVAVDKKKLPKYGGEMTGIKSNLARSTKF